MSLGMGRFLAGESVNYHGVAFYTSGKRILQVDSFSEWPPEQTSEEHAKAQIVRSKDVLRDLSAKSPAFCSAVRELRPQFAVCHNYGNGSVALASEIRGKFQWLHGGEV
jgi:hypothetical protein